jgi:hypothetical protein
MKLFTLDALFEWQNSHLIRALPIMLLTRQGRMEIGTWRMNDCVAWSLIYHQGFALINALALAKVVLVAEYFHVGDKFKNRPLIYPILFKSAVFAVILLCFHIIEETLIGILHGKTFSQSIPKIADGTLQGILMIGIIMFVVLTPFFAFRELGRAIGTEQLRSLLLGSEPKVGAAPPIVPGSPMAEK